MIHSSSISIMVFALRPSQPTKLNRTYCHMVQGSWGKGPNWSGTQWYPRWVHHRSGAKPALQWTKLETSHDDVRNVRTAIEQKGTITTSTFCFNVHGIEKNYNTYTSRQEDSKRSTHMHWLLYGSTVYACLKIGVPAVQFSGAEIRGHQKEIIHAVFFKGQKRSMTKKKRAIVAFQVNPSVGWWSN